MASGGMGDVLTGVCAALCAQVTGRNLLQSAVAWGLGLRSGRGMRCFQWSRLARVPLRQLACSTTSGRRFRSLRAGELLVTLKEGASIRTCKNGRLNDNIDMETSKQSTGAEKPKEDESKDAEQPVKNETDPARSADAKDPSPETSPDEEPGTFDRVYEHGRQMGF